MIRWGTSYVNGHGDRVLFGTAQGRHLFDTREECQAWIDAAHENSPHQLRSLLADAVSTLAPARFDCWDHGDPKGSYALEECRHAATYANDRSQEVCYDCGEELGR